jgi:hypothetical protein
MSVDAESLRQRRVAIAILSYLQKNPEAKDTLSGISRWWVHEDPVLVQRSLDLLVELGAVKKTKSVYSLAGHHPKDKMQRTLVRFRGQLSTN